MVDPVGLVKGMLDTLRAAYVAVYAVPELKTTLRLRYGDYASVIEPLESKPEVVIEEIERELGRLTELFTMVANLIGEYTAASGDGKWKKFNAKAKRAAHYKYVNEKLKEIDGEVMRQLAIMSLKGAISESEMELLKSLDAKVDRAISLLERLHPPTSPNIAAVPVGSVTLPNSYVERPGLKKEVVDGLNNQDHAIGPYIVLGMGGTGKTLMASAVVNDSSVRGHFRGGIFWMRVGRGGNKRLLPLLQGLAREVGVAATDAPHGVPHQFDNLEQLKQHLAVVATTGTVPRLVVLDDVWEREVLDALRPMGFQLLVTTRDQSVVGAPGGCTVVGDMTDDEALELLLKTSGTVGPLGDDVRILTTKVVAVCGRLPLVLAIAGSMPVVKGNGLTAGAWEELLETFQSKAKMMRAKGEEGRSLNTVLEASFDALSERKQAELLKMAVLPAGAVAPIAMLLNLWETQDVEGTRDEAKGLVSRCLLQVVDIGYRVHDLLLEFMRGEIKRDVDMLEVAIARQAQYLGRLDVVRGYDNPMLGTGHLSLFVLDALWRSLEELSGDRQLEASSYRTSLEKLEGREASADMPISCRKVGLLFEIQGKYADAELVCVRCTEIWEEIHGPEHPLVAEGLNARATLLGRQGKYDEAGPLHARAIAIGEKVLGPEHPDLAVWLNDLAVLSNRQGKYEEADPLYHRVLDILSVTVGEEHYNYGATLNNRAQLLRKQGKYEEADPLFQRSHAILEKVVGPDHPDVARLLNNRAELLHKQGKYEEADPLFQRSQATREKILGADHPDVAQSLSNRALLLSAQGKHDEAISLVERALAIRMNKLGKGHPDTVCTQEQLELVQNELVRGQETSVGLFRKHPCAQRTARKPGNDEDTSLQVAPKR